MKREAREGVTAVTGHEISTGEEGSKDLRRGKHEESKKVMGQ